MQYEYRLRSKSGEYKWFLGSGEVQFEKNTRTPLRIVGSIINIDHKKQYELVQAQQAALLALSPNAVITTDDNYVVRSWNKGAEKMYDIKEEDAIGHSLSNLFDTSYPYSTADEVLSSFKNDGSWEGEAHQVTKSGKRVYVLASVIALNKATKGLDGIMTVSSDISLLRVNKELNAALRMVENSTQYLEQLAYISSHDLKSPIITLQGLMNHLAARKAVVPGFETTFEMTREIVDQMKSTSVSLSSILQLRKNLISREFVSERIAVGQVVKDVVEMLKAPIESSNAQINIDVEKGQQIRMHHAFLKSILYNLISNSIKFKHPDRPPVISIKSDVAEDNVNIIVSDNGLGIDLRRYQNKLFSIFTRFHDDVEGNGVGLHSVKMIVDYHRGKINIESEEGKGTTITIKLPITADGQN
jgi:PAS domain S-box-containing protein